MSETAKHRKIVENYCAGNGVDLGSAGDPVVPWAIQVELPPELYHQYNLSRPEARVQWHGSALDLPFKDGTLDFVHSAHLLEDFRDWRSVLTEWDRVLKPGGFMMIAVPDHERFRAYVQRGKDAGVDCDNMSHVHESYIGELPEYFPTYTTLYDNWVNDDPLEHSILYIGKKNA